MQCSSLQFHGLRSRLAAYIVVATTIVVAFQNGHSAEPTNFILFIADDVSWNDYGCYGNSSARTPAIDSLAQNGLRFDQAFLTASSCSPSRSSIVTGRYPHNNGKAAELHLPIAANLPWFPELLRELGYYTALSGKNHMKMDAKIGNSPDHSRPKAFDLIDGGRAPGNSGGHANWVKITRDRPKDQPFFFWFAAYDAHRGWDADNQWDADKYGPMHSASDVVVPPFLVDSESTRGDLASYYNEVTRFDYYIGQVVRELEQQGELDNTLILILADNGRPFPRAKTRLHDSGMKTGLVAHWPNGIQSTGACNSLVSVIDIAPTLLSIATSQIAQQHVGYPTFQGVSMEHLFKDPTQSIRRYAFSEHNWHDYEAHGRSVRDGQFLYIKNNRPDASWQGPADSVRSPSFDALKTQRDAEKLTQAQHDVFLKPRPTEELYMVNDDPHQLNNLVNNPAYASDLQRLRNLMNEWSEATADDVPEQLSADSFDRETGNRIHKKESDYRGTTPGEQKNAWNVNASGPK